MSCNIYDASRGKLIKMAPLYKPSIPDGKTVVPTDDIQILLKCAGVKNKDYTTINEVIADTDTFNVIIDNDNAVDYLVRSTDWVSAVCADSTSMAYIAQSQYAAEQLLDDSTWYTGILNSSYRDVQFLLKTSGIFDKDYTTISQVLSDTASLSTVINSTRGIDYLVLTTAWASSVVADANAMTYIGQNNYASDTLLANSEWHDLICNSSYFESVLNMKIPKMTSNTTPAGYIASYGYSSGGREGQTEYSYRVFDNDDSTRGGISPSASQTNIINPYFSIQTPISYKVHKIYLYITTPASSSILTSVDYNIQGKNGNTWENIVTTTPSISNNTASQTLIINPTKKYSEYRILSSKDNAYAIVNPRTRIKSYNYYVATLQLYGRQDV